MSREVDPDNTQIMRRQIQGVPFDFYCPYAEGDVLNGAEAAALNQTRCENIKNNMADMVSTAVDEAKKTGTEINHADLQGEVTKYDLEYEFGMPRRGGRSGDPIEQEAKDMAWTLVTDALKRNGTKIKDVSAEDRSKYIQQTLEKYPVIRDRAKAVVAARQQAASELPLDIAI